MDRWWTFRSKVWDLEPCHCVVSHSTMSLPLHPCVYLGTGEISLGMTLQWTSIPYQEKAVPPIICFMLLKLELNCLGQRIMPHFATLHIEHKPGVQWTHSSFPGFTYFFFILLLLLTLLGNNYCSVCLLVYLMELLLLKVHFQDWSEKWKKITCLKDRDSTVSSLESCFIVIEMSFNFSK